MNTKVREGIVGKDTELGAIVRHKGNYVNALYNRWLLFLLILPKLYEVYRILTSYRPSLPPYASINELRVVKLSDNFISFKVRNDKIGERAQLGQPEVSA